MNVSGRGNSRLGVCCETSDRRAVAAYNKINCTPRNTTQSHSQLE